MWNINRGFLCVSLALSLNNDCPKCFSLSLSTMTVLKRALVIGLENIFENPNCLCLYPSFDSSQLIILGDFIDFPESHLPQLKMEIITASNDRTVTRIEWHHTCKAAKCCINTAYDNNNHKYYIVNLKLNLTAIPK